MFEYCPYCLDHRNITSTGRCVTCGQIAYPELAHKKNRLPLVVAGIVGAVILFCIASYFVMEGIRRFEDEYAGERFNVSKVPVPDLPERGEAEDHGSGIERYEIELGPDQDGFYETPGHGGKLWLYLPEGDHEDGSLPCLIIAPAGAAIIEGMDLAEGDEVEHLPYVREGFAVITYEVDGPYGDRQGSDEEQDRKVRLCYAAFRKAMAGVVNARNALEYVLARVPEVDPDRIYAAGHSSAATVALLFAAHEPRLAGCIAYAPVTDWYATDKAWIDEADQVLFGLRTFLKRASPITHVEHFDRPVFLFQAMDDEKVEYTHTKRFAKLLEEQGGGQVTFETVARGGHYDSMINEGIPRAIGWLREQQPDPPEPPETESDESDLEDVDDLIVGGTTQKTLVRTDPKLVFDGVPTGFHHSSAHLFQVRLRTGDRLVASTQGLSNTRHRRPRLMLLSDDMRMHRRGPGFAGTLKLEQGRGGDELTIDVKTAGTYVLAVYCHLNIVESMLYQLKVEPIQGKGPNALFDLPPAKTGKTREQPAKTLGPRLQKAVSRAQQVRITSSTPGALNRFSPQLQVGSLRAGTCVALFKIEPSPGERLFLRAVNADHRDLRIPQLEVLTRSLEPAARTVRIRSRKVTRGATEVRLTILREKTYILAVGIGAQDVSRKPLQFRLVVQR